MYDRLRISFASIGLFAAGFFFTREEIGALKRTEYFQNIALGLISLGLFAAFGTELAIGMASLWLLGSLFGGYIAVTAIFKFKTLDLEKA